jgi:hypothetical protein
VAPAAIPAAAVMPGGESWHYVDDVGADSGATGQRGCPLTGVIVAIMHVRALTHWSASRLTGGHLQLQYTRAFRAGPHPTAADRTDRTECYICNRPIQTERFKMHPQASWRWPSSRSWPRSAS